jgi:pimeloyl-ACP methyl ester carboxylesterase
MVSSSGVVRSSGLELAYRALGEGPALVLIHGWGANGREWDAAGWTDVLGVDRTLIVPDLRGHGHSAKPHDPGMYAMEAFARDIIALLDALGNDEADVFGYSMGATIALWVAVTEPSRVRSLIAGGVAGDAPSDAIRMGHALLGREPMTSRDHKYRDYALSMGEEDMGALGACLLTGLRPPGLAELAVFGGEALLAAGENDRRHSLTQDIAGRLPGGRFVSLEGADHMTAYTDPRYKSAVAEFLAEVSPIPPL